VGVHYPLDMAGAFLRGALSAGYCGGVFDSLPCRRGGKFLLSASQRRLGCKKWGSKGLGPLLAGMRLIFLAPLKKAGKPAFFNGAQAARAIAPALDSLVIFFVQNQVLIVGF